MPEKSFVTEVQELAALAKQHDVSVSAVALLVVAREVREVVRYLRDRDRPSGVAASW